MSKQDWRELEAYRAIGRPEELCKKQGWISVKDMLPWAKGVYLVYAPSYKGGSSTSQKNIRGVMFATWRNQTWSIEVGYYERPECVTHWMPLPDPPKEDNDGSLH